MSDRLTASGLQSSAGLFGQCGVYEFDLNGSIFNPQDLNPYLLFDAETSMIGTLENPTLDLDPSKQETLDVITATRAGSATFVNLDGEIEIAQPNTVRVDNSLGYPAILVEPSSVNLVTYSEDFSNAAWSKSGAGTGVAPIVTPNSGTSPDGTLSASRIQFNKGSGTGHTNMSIIFDAEATSSGATTSKSVYLKSNTTEAYEMVIYETTDASGTNVKKITVTPDWQRFQVYGSISSSTTGISIGLREINVSGLSNTADVLVWGAQLETGSVATSLIPTSGGNAAARTRAADDLVITGSAFSGFFNASEGTFYAEVIDRIPSENAGYLTGQSLNQAFLYSNINLAVDSFDGANFQRVSGVVAKELFRAAATYNSTTKTISFNGTTLADGAHNGNWATTNILNIGWSGSSVPTYGQFNGHIKRLIYWPYHSDSL